MIFTAGTAKAGLIFDPIILIGGVQHLLFHAPTNVPCQTNTNISLNFLQDAPDFLIHGPAQGCTLDSVNVKAAPEVVPILPAAAGAASVLRNVTNVSSH